MTKRRTDAATAARRVPDGWRNVRVEIRLPESIALSFSKMNPIERGIILMLAMEKKANEIQ